MICSSFGKCGSCVLWEIPYEKQLEIKKSRLKEMFKDLDIPEIEIIHSNDEHFRARAEFRIWHEGDRSFYAMRKRKEEGRGVIPIEECKIVDKAIYDLMPKLLSEIEKSDILRFKLYEIDFLSNKDGEVLVTLIYHKKVDESIGEEIKKLKQKGYKDFSLISQDSSSYLRDFNIKDGLERLIDEIDKIDNINVRILYLYPSTTTKRLVNKILSSKNVQNYFDMPIQHITPRMLKIMKRGSSVRKLKELLLLMKSEFSFVRTSVIVGHPGESEEIFQEGYKNLQKFPLTHIHLFRYSPRDGTYSATLRQDVKGNEAKKRHKLIDELIKKKNYNFH